MKEQLAVGLLISVPTTDRHVYLAPFGAGICGKDFLSRRTVHALLFVFKLT